MGDTLVTICARAGSKGLPGKNTRLLHGKPLIMWTVEHAIAWNELRRDRELELEVDYSKVNGDICVSTDSEEIKKLVGAGIDLIDRPEDLAGDGVAKVDVIKHAAAIMQRRKQKNYTTIIDLDVTNPMRTPEMIWEAVLKFHETDAMTLVSATKARKNPYFNQIEENYGFYRLVGGGRTGNFAGRQDAPKIWDMNASITIFSHLFFDLFEYAKTPTATPQLALYEMPEWCGFDIDTDLDFRIVEYLSCIDFQTGNDPK